MSEIHFWTDNLPEAGFAPGVHVAQLPISLEDGCLAAKCLVETREPALEYEMFDPPAGVAISVIDVTGHHFRPGNSPTDADILAAAALRLEWDLAVPLHCVRVAVDHGAVTLTGEVEWRGQRLGAERDAVSLPGVTTIFNQITLRIEGDEVCACDRIDHARMPPGCLSQKSSSSRDRVR